MVSLNFAQRSRNKQKKSFLNQKQSSLNLKERKSALSETVAVDEMIEDRDDDDEVIEDRADDYDDDEMIEDKVDDEQAQAETNEDELETSVDERILNKNFIS